MGVSVPFAFILPVCTGNSVKAHGKLARFPDDL